MRCPSYHRGLPPRTRRPTAWSFVASKEKRSLEDSVLLTTKQEQTLTIEFERGYSDFEADTLKGAGKRTSTLAEILREGQKKTLGECLSKRSLLHGNHYWISRRLDWRSINLHDSIKPFECSLRNGTEVSIASMSSAQDFEALKAQLEERIANLAREKEAVQREVEALSQKVALKELERQAKALEGELGGLKGKKSALEQRLAGYVAPPAQGAQPQPKPMVKPVAQQAVV